MNENDDVPLCGVSKRRLRRALILISKRRFLIVK
jgi:hypothetical protein